MEKKIYEAPMLEMISFETQELLANGGDNVSNWEWDPNMGEQPGAGM